MTGARRCAGALLALAQLGWREAAAEWTTLAGRALVFALPVAIFAAIWDATPLAAITLPKHDAAHLVWYVTITEVIVFAMALPFREVEAEIRSGRIESKLTRPVPYTLAVFAEACGGGLLRFLALAAFGLALGFALTGTLPVHASALLPLLLAAWLGCVMGIAFQLAIGLATPWIGEASPLFWIWQKGLFVLGGLLLPLTLYPAGVTAVAWFTPFPAMLFLPAGLVFDDGAGAVAACLAQQAAWSAPIALGLALIDRRAMARFLRQGA